MGIFGREDRTDEGKAEPSQPPSKQQSTARPGAASVTVIARSNWVEGTLLGSGDVRVEGQLKGGVDSSGLLVVAESGRVEGRISARSVTISGAVVGDVSAAERIELDASAQVEGNITSPRILINDGATFDGQVFMKEPDKTAAGEANRDINTSSARRPEPPEEEKEEEEKE
jgi:cytoskeletal protein CcmA (bactofilin family)